MISQIQNKFDTLNYCTDNLWLNSKQRQKIVIGVFEDTFGGQIIAEFVGLRARCFNIE